MNRADLLATEAPDTGREIMEDGTVVNTADLMTTWTDKSGGIRTLNEVQSAVHDGEAFIFSFNQISLANAATVQVLFRTGTKQVHLDGISVDVSQAPVYINLYEAPTVTTTGTQQTTRRKNRNNPTVSLTTLFLNATVSAPGTIMDTQLIVAVSQGNTKTNGTAEVSTGWVLKPNTDYYIIITNSSGAAINYNAEITWHEATYNV